MNARIRTILVGLFAAPLVSAAGPGPAAGAEVELELISGFPFVSGQAANGHSVPRRQSADGRFVAFHTEANNLQPGIVDTNNKAEVYLLDRQTGAFDLISRCAADGNRACSSETAVLGQTAIRVSDDGRWVAYESESRELVAGVTYPGLGSTDWQVYLFDRVDRVTRLVSHAPGVATTAAQSDARLSLMSPDGRWLVFHTASRNLAGPTNSFTQIFLYDRTTGESVMVSHAAGAPATPGSGASTAREITSDGRFLLLQSAAANLVAGHIDAASTNDVFVYDRQTDSFELISRDAADPLLAVGGTPRDLSPDGRFVLLDTPGVQLAAGRVDANGAGFDTFVFDRQTGTAQLASHAFKPEISGAATTSTGHRLSDDGRFSYFICNGANLVDAIVDNNGTGQDVFVFDRSTGQVSLVSHAPGSAIQGANAAVFLPTLGETLSPDGRYQLMMTAATNLQDEVTDVNGASDLFLADRLGAIRLLSRVGSSLAAGGVSSADALLGSDLSVVFTSDGKLDAAAPDPFPGRDIFRFDAASSAVSLLTATPLSAAKSPLPKDILAPFSYGGGLDRAGRWAVWGPYVWDRITGNLDRYLHAAGAPGVPADTNSAFGRTTPDGRFVAFSTLATNIAAVTDANQQRDVYFYDRNVDAAFLVSHAAGAPSSTADEDSTLPWFSDDARHFALESRATNLMPGMAVAAGRPHNVYLYDRTIGSAELVSHDFASVSQSGDHGSSFVEIAPDRSWLVFTSGAENLVPDFVDHNNYFLDLQAQESSRQDSSRQDSSRQDSSRQDSPEGLVYAHDLYFYDRATRTTTLITRLPFSVNDGSEGTPYPRARATAGGASIFYSGDADDLVPGQAARPKSLKIFHWNRATRSNELVITEPGQPTVPCDGEALLVDLTPDGRWLLFNSDCRLAPGDLNFSTDAYLLDRQSGQIQLVNHLPGLPTTPAGPYASAHSISDDGRRILYSVAGIPYSYDRPSGQAILLSFAYYDPEKKVPAYPQASDDGTRILLQSGQSDLTPYDSNGRSSGGLDYFLVTLPDLFADGFESGTTSGWSLVF